MGELIQHAKGVGSRAVVAANHDPQSGNDGLFGDAQLQDNCDQLINDAGARKVNAHCQRDSRDPLRFAIIGDSKAGALFRGLVRTSTDAGRWEIIDGNAMNGAPIPVLSTQTIYQRHQQLATAALRSLAASKGIETVVFAVAARTLFALGTDSDINDLPQSPWYPAAFAGMSRAADELVRSGKKVVLLADNPTLPYPQQCWERRTGSVLADRVLRLEERNKPCILKLDEYYRLASQYRSLLLAVQKTNPGQIFIFDTIPYLCDQARNECTTFLDGRPLYGHTDHLSDYGAGIIGRELNRFALNLGKYGPAHASDTSEQLQLLSTARP